jgi:hypothetical protein
MGTSSVADGSAETSGCAAGSDATAGAGMLIRAFARDHRGSRFGTGALAMGTSSVADGSAETSGGAAGSGAAGSDAVTGGGAAGGGLGGTCMLCSIESSLRVSRSIALTASQDDNAATSTLGLIVSGDPAAKI